MLKLVLNPLADHVWRSRYRHQPPGGPAERDVMETFERVAAALAAVEREPDRWRARFLAEMAGLRFLPAGRVLAGAGTAGATTLLNCFVMGPVDDSVDGAFEALKEGARTLRAGGGVGYDFTTLRPRSPAGPGRTQAAAGPVAWLQLWDVACATVTAGTGRGGAMMGTLAIDHPDIEEFVDAKRAAGVLPHFNLSVLVSDAFLAAVEGDAAWVLGEGQRTVSARALWHHIATASLAASEPGVLFVDTINRENNLAWRERLAATNPCGEAPLPPYGACDLGSINLAAFVREPFTARAAVDHPALEASVQVAVRLLDDVLEVARYPLMRQREAALATRRVGLGVTGLGDALAMLGLRYGSDASIVAAGSLMERIKLSAYRASVELAAEKGPFPAYERDRYLAAPFVSRLPGGLRDAIAARSIRNSHLLAIAPTGSISLLANNVSPGLEPIPGRVQRRRVTDPVGGGTREFTVEDWAWSRFRATGAAAGADAFVEALEVGPADQLRVQAALQAHVDGSVSKTLTLPASFEAGELAALYLAAHRAGVKGVAAYRANTVRGSVLEAGCRAPAAAGCDPA